jgi:hypothetical protein
MKITTQKKIKKLETENSSNLKLGIITGTCSLAELFILINMQWNLMQTIGMILFFIGTAIISICFFYSISINNKFKDIYIKLDEYE